MEDNTNRASTGNLGLTSKGVVGHNSLEELVFLIATQLSYFFNNIVKVWAILIGLQEAFSYYQSYSHIIDNRFNSLSSKYKGDWCLSQIQKNIDRLQTAFKECRITHITQETNKEVNWLARVLVGEMLSFVKIFQFSGTWPSKGDSPLLLIMMTLQLNDRIVLVVLEMFFFVDLHYFRYKVSTRYHLEHGTRLYVPYDRWWETLLQ